MKKGQIVFFIIVGMLLVIVFSFLLYIASIARTVEVNDHIIKASQSQVSAGALKNYIQACLNVIAEDALLSLGQNGTLRRDVPTLPYLTAKVGYGIREPVYGGSVGPSDPPRYPFPHFMTETKDLPVLDNLYGKRTFAELCDSTGPNAFSVSNFNFCYSSNDGSIEQQLKEVIEASMQHCMKDYGVAQPNLSIYFGAEAVSFELAYPTNISIGKDTSIQVDSVIVKKPLRLKLIHDFARRIINQDIDYCNYAITNDDNGVNNYYQFTVRKIERACPDCIGQEFDDVIEIIDDRSLLQGVPYIYRFARQNRIPALAYIGDLPRPTEDGIDDVNIAILSTALTLSFDIKTCDPDEDTTFITYDNYEIIMTSAEDFWKHPLVHQPSLPGKVVMTIDSSDLPSMSEAEKKYQLQVNVTDDGGRWDSQVVKIVLMKPP